MIRRIPPSIAFTVAAAFVLLLPSMVHADCTIGYVDQFGNFPHQGAGKYPTTANSLYGASANISYGDPLLGCPPSTFSFTSEWVMVVAPGTAEWLQFGWRKVTGNSTVHLWYEYSNATTFVDIELPYQQVTTHEYKLMAVPDQQSGNMTWWVVDSSYVWDQLTATGMGWTQPASGARFAQWSGEVTNVENEMGGLLPNLVTIDNLYYQEGDPTNAWQAAQPSEVYNSFAPQYGGDPMNVADFAGALHNWTWPYLTYLPLLENNP